MWNGSTKMMLMMATTNGSRASRTVVGSRLPSSCTSSGRSPFSLAIRSSSFSPLSLPQSASQRGVAASFRAAPLLARSQRPFCAHPLLPQRRFLSTSSKNFRELESVTVAEKKDIWKHAWPFLIVATAFATYMIRGNKFEAKKPKPTTAFQIKSNELPKVTLFQLDHSPTTKQVRAMMDYNGIPYEVKELNPVNRRQLSFLERDRKAVILPLAIIGEAQVETAREIMELLENVLSIQEAARLANQQLEASSSQEQNTTNENAEGQPSSKQKMRQHLFHKNLQELKTANAQKREKELGLIQRVEAQLLPLISVNRFTTWKQSRLAIRSIKEEESFTWWERFWLPFWYATTLRNQNRYSRKHIKHIYGDDLRSALAKEVGNWIEILGDKPFFGGDKPDFVDFYVYGALVSAEEEPTGEYILQHVPQVQPYLQRMTQAVNPSWKRKKQQGQ